MGAKTTHLGFLLILAVMLCMGLITYPQLPELIASHWNMRGEADGYINKAWGTFVFPVMLAVIYLLYLLIPKIDPLKANIKSFETKYNLFFLGMGVFFAYLFALSTAWNLGYRFDFGTAILPASAGLLWLLSVLMSDAKRNWFIGIRTPWTLSNDKVWKQTHKLGALLFKIAAVITLAGTLLGGQVGFWLFFTSLLAIVVITVAYSYAVYHKS